MTTISIALVDDISIALVDDDALIVSLLNDLLQGQENIQVIMTAESGEDFIAQLDKAEKIPELVVLDLRMKQQSGIDTTLILKENYPDIKILIMSSHYKKKFMGFMLKTGVAAFMPKDISKAQLVEAINEVHVRGHYFLPDQIDVLRTQVSAKTPKLSVRPEDNLSQREIDVLKLICFQKTAKEISKELFIAARTVEGHKSNLFLKTRAKNVAGLVIFAIQNQLIAPDEIPLIN